MEEYNESDELPRRRPRLVRSRLQGKVFLIPSFITVIGIFCGFLAVVSAFKGAYEYAAKAIALAMILDGLDGRVARRLNATSDFGKEFDSLSDVIALGVAPATLLYAWGFQSAADEFGVLVSFLFVGCAATRLARFNVSEGPEPARRFEGLPMPGAASAIVALVYCFPLQVSSETAVAFVFAYALCIAGLMVSTFPYPSIKHFKLTDGNVRAYAFLLFLSVAVTWYHSRIVLFVLALAYVCSGPGVYLAQRTSRMAQRKRA